MGTSRVETVDGWYDLHLKTIDASQFQICRSGRTRHTADQRVAAKTTLASDASTCCILKSDGHTFPSFNGLM